MPDHRLQEHQQRVACGDCGRETTLAGLKMHRCNYKALWRHANPDPSTWRCYFCSETILPDLHPNSPLALNVHHLDEDRSNNALSNLVGTHHSCHTSHHLSAREPSTATIAALDAGRRLSPGLVSRARMSAAHTRRAPETKLVNIKHRCECGMITNVGSMVRHRQRTGHTSERVT